MSVTTHPQQRFSRIAFLAAVLLAGVGLGVLLDRLWLRLSPGTNPDPRLVGRWISETDQAPLEFKPDGTIEYVKVTTSGISVDGRPDPKPSRAEHLVTGQYRWADGDVIEVIEPDLPAWIPVKVVIDGDRLNLLRQNGSVRRYARAK